MSRRVLWDAACISLVRQIRSMLYTIEHEILLFLRWFGIIGMLVCATFAQDVFAQDLWLMKGHDVRRTGQSVGNGPREIDPQQSWTVTVPGAHTINIGASVDASGAYFGSWGLLRRDPAHPADPRFWDKSDGALYGLNLEQGASLWGGPAELDLVARCYDFQDRGPDLVWCGFTPYKGSFYNGTVEGQAAIDTSRNVLYVGRGDGKLYAVDTRAGAVLWRYQTYNPLLPEDPDGGGEVVSAPLIGPEDLIYFGTWGEGGYETNAFYAVDANGALQWRYPAAASLANRIFAAPALSPDGSTIYVSTYYDDEQERPATLYAFEREPTSAIADEERLKWAIDLTNDAGLVRTTTLAVGSDGTIYVAGYVASGLGIPVVTAIEDLPGGPGFKWSMQYAELRADAAQFVLGLALREVDGVTRRIYATTANVGSTLTNALESGRLYAIDPATGSVLANYDPSDDDARAVGGLNSPAIGADGTIYFGVRGRFHVGATEARKGHYFAIRYDPQGAAFEHVWNVEVDGYVEWNHPAIGPDGGLYAGSSSVDETVRTQTHDEGVVPEGSTAYFHALKGPASPVATSPEFSGEVVFGIAGPYPNPFSARTTLSLEVFRPGAVSLDVFDLLGRRVRKISGGFVTAGRQDLIWNGENDAAQPVPPGLYLLRMQASGRAGTAIQNRTLPVVLLR